MTTAKQAKKATPGPDPERLKIIGDWEDAAAQVVTVPRPAKGWPGPTPRAKKKKGKKKAKRKTARRKTGKKKTRRSK